jgi:hypothetical protein
MIHILDITYTVHVFPPQKSPIRTSATREVINRYASHSIIRLSFILHVHTLYNVYAMYSN